jgi:hypothetical protein
LDVGRLSGFGARKAADFRFAELVPYWEALPDAVSDRDEKRLHLSADRVK